MTNMQFSDVHPVSDTTKTHSTTGEDLVVHDVCLCPVVIFSMEYKYQQQSIGGYIVSFHIKLFNGTKKD